MAKRICANCSGEIRVIKEGLFTKRYCPYCNKFVDTITVLDNWDSTDDTTGNKTSEGVRVGDMG